uniref:Uncharacterized protein n=1 Tax=Arundo donax TaxID=35708 RepID=A0A0A9FQL1_ARUDO
MQCRTALKDPTSCCDDQFQQFKIISPENGSLSLEVTIL